MSNQVVITYEQEQVSVPKEVAEFLTQERRREASAARRDRRHLSKSDFETVLFCKANDCEGTETLVERNLQLENLRNAVAGLEEQKQDFLSLRYCDELSMEEIGKLYVISKMAVSKRLKKLHKELRGSVM